MHKRIKITINPMTAFCTQTLVKKQEAIPAS
jgi:hypothetical protein